MDTRVKESKLDPVTLEVVRNALPAMNQAHGFQLAVADDAANQLLASLWAANGTAVALQRTTRTMSFSMPSSPAALRAVRPPILLALDRHSRPGSPRLVARAEHHGSRDRSKGSRRTPRRGHRR